MKRLLVFIMVLFVSVSVMFSNNATNYQKVYPLDSDIYEMIDNLYISAGYSLPSTSRPWNDAEVRLILSRIDNENLSETSRKLYEHIVAEIDNQVRFDVDDSFGLTTGVDFRFETNIHTNPKKFNSPNDWKEGNGDIPVPIPLLRIPLETWIGSMVYGYSELDFAVPTELDLSGTDYSKTFFRTNIPFGTIGFKSYQMDMSFPFRAIGSIGGDHWNFSLGREKLKWGNGESGTLMVGEQIPYHTNARFTAFSDRFKYTYLISSFIHPANYTEQSSDGKDYIKEGPLQYDQNEPRKGLRLFVGHRLEWRILSNLNFAISESIMYQSEEGIFDFNILNPSMLYHNLLIRSNANSLLGLEMDYSPISHLNLYGEFILDEATTVAEKSTGKGSPGAMGFILGAKTSFLTDHGMWYGSLEGAYTDPYLYLRDTGKTTSDGRNGNEYGINFVIGFPDYGTAEYKFDFMGYRYGGDSIVANLNGGYKSYDNWFVEGNLMYMAHGTFDEFTRWKQVLPDEVGFGPTDKNTNESYLKGDGSDLRDSVSHTINIGVKSGITLFNNFDIYGQIDSINIFNYRNIKANGFASDFRFTFGLKYSM